MYPILTKKIWWDYLEEDVKELLLESQNLAEKVQNWEQKFHDYSFVVFPAAKAYEGFLKRLFLDMGFITKEEYYGRHFRIGKSLNPQLEKKYRNDDWVFEKLTHYCKGKELPDKLWDTWKKSRNLLFHWFPNELNAVTLKEAGERFKMVISAIDEVFSVCELDLKTK